MTAEPLINIPAKLAAKLVRAGSFCHLGDHGVSVRKDGTRTPMMCTPTKPGERGRWRRDPDGQITGGPPPAVPAPAAPGPDQPQLPIAAPMPIAAPTASAVLVEPWRIGRNAAQKAVPLRWTYDTRQVDPDCQHLVDDPAAASAAIANYVSDKCFASSGDAEQAMTPTINAALRGHTPMTPERQRTVDVLDGLFHRSVLAEPVTVYRGISDGRHIMPADWRTRDLAGLTWSDPAYTSTSGSEEYVGEYGSADATSKSSFAVRVTVPAGQSALTIWDVEDGDDEGEVLLPRGCRFRVVKDRGFTGEYGTRWLDVEVTQP